MPSLADSIEVQFERVKDCASAWVGENTRQGESLMALSDQQNMLIVE
jgi:hypothetical protein